MIVTDNRSTCRHCGIEISYEPGLAGWVDVVSGDDGGTFDFCESNGYDGHEPKRP